MGDTIMDGEVGMADGIPAVGNSSHIPINYTSLYRMCTFNIGDRKKNKEQMDILHELAEKHQPDIIFCQENLVINDTRINNVYISLCYTADRSGGAILVKKSKINRACLVEYDREADELKNGLSGHQCTVLIDNMIAITWHGPHNIVDVGKKQHFETLLKYAFKLSKRYKLPVIIGGDFNLPPEKTIQYTAEQILLRGGLGYLNNSKFTIKYCKDKPGNNYDYFILLSAAKDTDELEGQLARINLDNDGQAEQENQ